MQPDVHHSVPGSSSELPLSCPSRETAVAEPGPLVLRPALPGWGTTRTHHTACSAVEETALGLDGGGAEAHTGPTEEP